jgi:hypothetical protein
MCVNFWLGAEIRRCSCRTRRATLQTSRPRSATASCKAPSALPHHPQWSAKDEAAEKHLLSAGIKWRQAEAASSFGDYTLCQQASSGNRQRQQALACCQSTPPHGVSQRCNSACRQVLDFEKSSRLSLNGAASSFCPQLGQATSCDSKRWGAGFQFALGSCACCGNPTLAIAVLSIKGHSGEAALMQY